MRKTRQTMEIITSRSKMTKIVRSLTAVVLAIASNTAVAQTDTITCAVAPAQKMQVCEGWGASICWWGNMCGRWSDATVDKMIDWLVSPDGLNMNIFRYNIGGGDDPHNAHCTPHHMGKGKGLRAEMEGFQDFPGGPYIWERDSAQRRIMLKIKEKRPDAIFEAFSNSAPWWMTFSGCVGGNVNATDDNLKPEYYEAFAHYLVDVCVHYKEKYGIEFRTLDPFNEPNTNYWPANGSQEGCHFSAKAQADFLKILHPILKASGLNTVISASDETSVATAVKTLQTLQEEGVDSLVDQWNTHTYINNNRSRSQFGSLARSTKKPVWMSEVGCSGKGIGGNLNVSRTMFKDIHYIVPTAWIDWQYHEEKGDQWCLVNGVYEAEHEMGKTKNYYVRQNVTRYIRQGYFFIPSTSENTLAAVSPHLDTLVVSVINNNDNVGVQRIDMPFTIPASSAKSFVTTPTDDCAKAKGLVKVQKDHSLVVSLPARSIVTVVLPVKVNEQERTPKAGGIYLIQPQSNIEMALSVVDNNVALAKADIHAPAQRWTLEESPRHDGKMILRNGDGAILSYDRRTGDYFLIAHKGITPNYTQAFSILPVEDYFYRISYGTKAFDLQGNGLSEGTKVGMYEYGDSPVADTRQWRFLKVTSKSGI